MTYHIKVQQSEEKVLGRGTGLIGLSVTLNSQSHTAFLACTNKFLSWLSTLYGYVARHNGALNPELEKRTRPGSTGTNAVWWIFSKVWRDWGIIIHYMHCLRSTTSLLYYYVLEKVEQRNCSIFYLDILDSLLGGVGNFNLGWNFFLMIIQIFSQSHFQTDFSWAQRESLSNRSRRLFLATLQLCELNLPDS